MDQAPTHRCELLGSPWQGVHGTSIDSARHYGRHWHATYGFGLLEQGAQRSASGRGTVEACAGDLITTNPGEVHDGRPLGGPTRRWHMVYLEPSVMASISGRADVALTRPVFQDAQLARAVRRLFACLLDWNADPRTDALACEERLVRACALLLERHATRLPTDEAGVDVAQVRERLAGEWLAPPSLAALASMVGASRYQLLRRFEKAYGVPPHAWLLALRAERARGLIGAGAGLAEAAAACGFADQSHMTRTFVRHFGFTPGAWRRTQMRRLQ